MTAKIQDYILEKDIVNENQKNKTEQPKNSVVKVKKQELAKLEIVIENETDLVLRKTGKRTCHELVLLFGKEQFYIHNITKDTITILKDKDGKRAISSFFRNIDIESLEFKKIPYVAFLTKEDLFNFVNDNYFRYIIKNNMYLELSAINFNSTSFLYYAEKTSKKFVVESVKTFKSSIDHWCCYRNLIELNKFLGNNLYFEVLENLRNHKIRFGFGSSDLSKLCNTFKKYNINPKRFAEYLSIDLPNQGLTELANVLSLYFDYLKMASMIRKKYDKYPKYLKTEHDIVSMKFNYLKRFKKTFSLEDFYKDYKNLEYSSRIFSIVMPKESIDVIDEGFNLNHCVASYVDNIIEEDCLILFLRRTESLDESLVTVEYNIDDNCIVQARGSVNRALSRDEFKFLEKWAKEKDIILGGISHE